MNNINTMLVFFFVNFATQQIATCLRSVRMRNLVIRLREYKFNNTHWVEQPAESDSEEFQLAELAP